MVSNKNFRVSPVIKVVLKELVIIILVIIWLIPVYALIIDSFKSNVAVVATNTLTPALPLTFVAYQEAWKALAHPLLNSFLLVVPISVLSTILGGLGAYYLSNLTRSFDPKDRILGNILFTLIGLGTFLPYEATMMPLVNLLTKLQLFGSYWGLLIGYLIFYLPTGALLMAIFITTVPSYLIDAAKMDSASDTTIFFRVVLPVTMPGFISTLIFILIESWNNFFLPLLLVTTPSTELASVATRYFTGGYGTLYNASFAAATIASLVPLVIFIFLGRYFIRGLLALGGGAKI